MRASASDESPKAISESALLAVFGILLVRKRFGRRR
jgi:hypothetical protein